MLVAARRRVDKLAAIAERIGGEWIAVDLGDPAQVDGFAAACVAKLGRVDVLVNNAGVETTDAFVAVDRDRLRAVARLNYEATMLLTRDFLTPMLARGTGHIVQMSSLAGAIPFPGLAVYAGTKAGLTNFTETLRLELRRTGVGLTRRLPRAGRHRHVGSSRQLRPAVPTPGVEALPPPPVPPQDQP